MKILKFDFDDYTRHRLEAVLEKTGAASFGEVVRQAIHLYDHALHNNAATLRSILETQSETKEPK